MEKTTVTTKEQKSLRGASFEGNSLSEHPGVPASPQIKLEEWVYVSNSNIDQKNMATTNTYMSHSMTDDSDQVGTSIQGLQC